MSKKHDIKESLKKDLSISEVDTLSVFDGINAEVIKVDTRENMYKAIEILKKDKNVKHVSSDYIPVDLNSVNPSNDPGFANQWGLYDFAQPVDGTVEPVNLDIGAYSGWASSNGGSNVLIGQGNRMMKMKKAICLISCLTIFILSLSGCKNSPQKVVADSSEIVISYTISSYIARIIDKKDIKKLENLFNEAEFEKSDIPMIPEHLSITFYGEKGTTKFKIDVKDVIKLNDGSYVKCKQLSFAKVYSIFRDYSINKK